MEQPLRSGAGMLCTQGCWDHHPATLPPPSLLQRVPRSLEPWATQFWGALIPKHPKAMETHISKGAHPPPDPALGQRTSTCRTSPRRMTPGALPALHLRTRMKKVSSLGSPFPNQG